MTEKPVAEMTFEEAMKALEQVVDRLEAQDVPLEDSIRLYERGAELKAHCAAKLKAAEEKVATITTDAEGQPTGTRPFDAG